MNGAGRATVGSEPRVLGRFEESGVQPRILVTGATGNVGSQVVKLLRAMDQPVVAAVMDAADAKNVPGINSKTVVFDFTEPETYAPALVGVKKLFLMRPPPISDVRRYLNPVVDQAKDAGVEHITFLSLMGVERYRFVPHYKVEQHILASGIPYTFLRPSFYMQNLNTTHCEEIKERNELFLPVGRAKTSFIDVRDIGAVAAKVLAESGHENQAYELTGGEALDYYQVAEIFSEILGRKIIYRNPNVFQFVHAWRGTGLPLQYVLVMAVLYTSTRFGMAAQVTQDVERLLGRSPLTMRQYIEDYAEHWRPESAGISPAEVSKSRIEL